MAENPSAQNVDPIRLTTTVALPPADAFRLFTDGIDTWWPLREGFSYGGELAKEVHLEAVNNGRFYERYRDGREFEVGRVRLCDPPKRIVFSWQGDWSAPTEVEIRFIAQGLATRVELEHRAWERLAAPERHWRNAFNNGWPRVLAAFAATGNTSNQT